MESETNSQKPRIYFAGFSIAKILKLSDIKQKENTLVECLAQADWAEQSGRPAGRNACTSRECFLFAS
jgi:hypothetical protein